MRLPSRINGLGARVMKAPDVMGMDATLDYILEHRASVARFGDGEFDIIFGRNEGFQKTDKRLASLLQHVLRANDESETFLVGIPDCFGGLGQFTEAARFHWQIRLDKERIRWYRLLNRRAPYWQAQISRFYFDWADKSNSGRWLSKLKKIWEGRNVLIAEGQQTRMGMGNDLLGGARSIRRIICPARQAFDVYDTILAEILRQVRPGDLVLLALGPTASVLAYDLHKRGVQAIDIGHVDIEYVWYNNRATVKERVPGRFMNEIDGGAEVDDTCADPKYLSQIISTITI